MTQSNKMFTILISILRKDPMITLLAFTLVVMIFAPIKALAEDDYAEAIVGSNIYKFDWDYVITYGDNNPEDLDVEKNMNDRQDVVMAKAGKNIDAVVHTCCGDYGFLNVSIANDVTVSADGEVEILNEKPAVQVGGCHDEDCKQTWQIPDANTGMYNLIYFVIGETEVNEIYVTQVRIIE